MRGEIILVQVETDAFKSVIVMCEEENVRIDEGDRVTFVPESTGEVKIGVVTKISGKGEKTKLQILPVGSQCEEIWPLINIAENSLKLYVEG